MTGENLTRGPKPVRHGSHVDGFHSLWRQPPPASNARTHRLTTDVSRILGNNHDKRRCTSADDRSQKSQGGQRVAHKQTNAWLLCTPIWRRTYVAFGTR